MDTLSTLLISFMARAQIGSRRLSRVTGIPRTSIDNWRSGTVQHPNQWQQLLILAHALALTRDEANALLITAGFSSLDILAHELSIEDPDWRYLQPWLAVAPTKPMTMPLSLLHQLQTPVRDFVGRRDAITTLVTALKSARAGEGVAAIGGVQGMGGVGKTELAFIIAHRLRDHFHDAQIVLNLRGSSTEPLTAAQAVKTIIYAFAPNMQLPDDLLTLERYYRTLLHDRHTLILADDARNAAHVQSLIPPAGNALLVTSRQRFTLPGMTTINLEQLPTADAVILLRGICPRLSSDEAQSLAQAYGYLPLALRVTGGILSATPALTADEYLKRLVGSRQRLAHLRDPDDPHLDVAASLAASYTLLDAAAQQVFRQLGVFMADFTTALAQKVVEVSEDIDVAVMLEHLLRRNLVQYDTVRACWRLHDLIRDLAQHYLEEAGEATATMWRYAQAAVHLAQATQTQYLSGGDAVVGALARFDAERPHVESGYRWAAQHLGTWDGDNLLLALTLATTEIGELRADAKRERIPQLERALVAARRLGEPSAEGQLLLSLGRARFDLGTFQQAIAMWECALDIFQDLNDQHSEGLVLGNLGTAYARLGNPSRAIAAFEQALVRFHALDDQRHAAHAVGNLGAAYADLDTAHAALPYLDEALAYARAEGDRRFESMLLHAFGDMACALGDPQRACSVCTDALAITREIGDRQQEGYTLITLGHAYVGCGNHQRAITAFDQALTILQDIQDGWGAATCRWHYGLLLMEQGRRDHALSMLRESTLYVRHIGHAQAEAQMALLSRLEAGETLAPRHPMTQRSMGGDTETRGHAAADR